MKKVGFGIFTWNGEERRSQRYGFFALLSSNYNEDVRCSVELDREALNAFAGQRVRILAVVRATRESGHIGDMALKIKPSQPELGEEIELGVGTLQLEASPLMEGLVIGLQPSDGRHVFWLDPRKLYRLHDQTVDLYIETTSQSEHAAPDIRPTEEGVVSTGDGDGSFQVVGRMPIKVRPTVESLGGGLFKMGVPQGAGQPVTVEYPKEH